MSNKCVTEFKMAIPTAIQTLMKQWSLLRSANPKNEKGHSSSGEQSNPHLNRSALSVAYRRVRQSGDHHL